MEFVGLLVFLIVVGALVVGVWKGLAFLFAGKKTEDVKDSGDAIVAIGCGAGFLFILAVGLGLINC